MSANQIENLGISNREAGHGAGGNGRAKQELGDSGGGAGGKDGHHGSDATMRELLESMVKAKQMSQADAQSLIGECERGERAAVATEAEALRWLAAEYDLPYSDLSNADPDKSLLSRFPARVLLKEELLPIRRDAQCVYIATSRLFEPKGLDTLRLMTGETLAPVLAPSEAIRREMKKRLGVGADTIDTMDEEGRLEVLDERDDDDVDLEGAEDASIIRFCNQVMAEAISVRATDIHLEPFEDELRIRYRIDGVLREVPAPSSVKKFQSAIISRVKILSHLDIAEKRLPQDGRIKIRRDGSEIDVRVSVIPMLHGEGVVLRLLRQDSALLGLNELRMGEREERIMRAVLEMPHGIMLVTGPTGSGKTTTLYAALAEINDLDRKIITIEDPIEYQMKGVNQIQVSEKAGLTFARGLRSILRHDPDVLLVGEIRDAETARIAVQASLTGHLVFSTLHTNDAPTAMTRLIDMGVEPYLVASSLEAVLAQRLTRLICESCREVDDSKAARTYRKYIPIEENDPLFRGAGCEACRMTGYAGRRGLFELMAITEEVRQLVLESASAGRIKDMARRQGMITMREDGWRLVAEGSTTVAEVLRATKDEALSEAFSTIA
ncbi:MAG: Type II secretion system protein E [candidate division BRC1 bacterium ADurb.BinA364]|nr:MAG: Type II secretion system protein E [candidate division BRC1 bacterium ADurb.BinA364]